jgi:hypothetical protein
MFWRREVMGTVALECLERFAVRILRYCAERRLWEKKEGLKPTVGEEEAEQEEPREDAVEEEEF